MSDLLNYEVSIVKRKEFYSYLQTKTPTNNKSIDVRSIKKKLKDSYILQWYQKMFLELFRPDTDIQAILIKGEPGIGKTLIDMSVACEFSKTYGENNLANLNEGPKVFILTFQSHIFINEAIKNTNLGFITQGEKYEYNTIKNKLISESLTDKEIIFLRNRAKEITTNVKQRITDEIPYRKSKIIFIGYQKLVNKTLYIGKCNDIEKIYNSHHKDDVVTFLDNLDRENVVKINHDFVSSFDNSLIIADELHVTHNKEGLNSRGIVLKYILDKAKNVRMIATDGTPIMSKETQLIPVLNLFCPKKHFRHEDFFDENNNFIKKNKDKLIDIIKGRIYTIKNIDLSIFPNISYEGGLIRYFDPLDKKKEKYIEELNFVEAPLTGIQKKIILEQESFFNTENSNIIHNDSIYEIILLDDNDKIVNSENDLVGSKKYQYNVSSINSPNIERKFKMLSGPIFEKKNIKNFSSKYYTMLNVLDMICAKKYGGGKIIIFHRNIEYPGVNLIETILRENGFIDVNEKEKENTRCYECDKPRNKHVDLNHEYFPARFINIHTYVNHKIISRLIEEFNMLAPNKFGKYIKILIGSRLIEVGVDFNNVQNIITLCNNPSINSLLQTQGRGARATALISLPKEMQHLHMFNIIATLPDQNTADVIKWKNMIEDKHKINYIEDILNSSSITAAIYKDIFPIEANIYTDPKMIKYDKIADVRITSEFLSPSIKNAIVTVNDMNSVVDNMYFNINKTILIREFNIMLKIIKLFLLDLSVIYKDDLWDIIINSDIDIGINKKFLNKNLFDLIILFLASNVNIENSRLSDFYKSASFSLSNVIHLDSIIEFLINNPFSKVIVNNNGSYKKLTILEDDLLVIRPIKENNNSFIDIPDVFEFGRRQLFNDVAVIPSKNIIKSTIDSDDIWTNQLHNDIIAVSSYKDIYHLFDKYQTISHANVIERLIIKNTNINDDNLKEGEELYINLLHELKYVFTYNELLLNNTIKMIIAANIKKELNTKIGAYIVNDILKLYNPVKKEWDTLNDKSLNLRKKLNPYKLTGSFVSTDSNQQKAYFKLRQESKKEADKRKIKRGIVCYSKNKEAILDLINNTDIKTKVNNNMLLMNICDIIKEELFKMEIKARKEDSNIYYITILDCKN